MNPIPVLQPDEIEEDRPMPSRNHSIVCQNLGGILHRFRETISTHQQLSLSLDGWKVIPDVCVYPREAMPRDWMIDADECTTAPALVIEVLSPKQNLQPLLEKVKEYLGHGVRSCWVVIPGTETISVFPQSGTSHSFSEGAVSDEALGIEVTLAEVFS
jgi:Uma2 family endonuclease